MYYREHKQLSLMAEDEIECQDYCDWSIDTAPSLELQRSIEAVREYFDGGQIKNPPPNSALHDGGQPQTRILSMEGSGCNRAEVSSACVAPSNGGQNKNCPPDSALHDGGQIKNSIFHKDRGDDGTWIEKQNRKTGIFEYLRWRELDGTKRAKYLGKVA